MQTANEEALGSSEPWFVTHSVTPEDRAIVAAARATAEPSKGRLVGTAARERFNGIMNQVLAPSGVTYQPDTVGGVPGWWCIPDKVRSGEAILHLHGGWFLWGSAISYRH